VRFALRPRSVGKAFLTFSLHQILGTWGIPVFAYYLGYSIFETIRRVGGNPPFHYLYWVLTETPYFPVQISLGLWFGWTLNRRLGHRAMVWVWVLPFLILTCALLAYPTLTIRYQSVIERVSKEGSSLSFYFGWGCQPKNRCLDQLVTTMPFYTAAAYSIGAALARKSTRVQNADV
jgi:hypothetical protein